MDELQLARVRVKKRLFPIFLSLLIIIQSLIAMSILHAEDKNFEAGSIIIPMDVTFQDMGMYKAYGLVYELLNKGIPVSWAINRTKSFNQADFVATAKDYFTNSSVFTHSYSGGPFIISNEYAPQALQIIQNFWSRSGNQPSVHLATESFYANIDIVLKSPPRIANEATNAGIAITYYNAAMIPDMNGKVWSSLSPNILTQTQIASGGLFSKGECSQTQFDVFVTPHNGGYSYSLTDPNNLGTRTYAQLDYFVNQGGGWVAMCHSILSNENAISNLYRNSNTAVRSMFNSSTNGGFLTVNGFTTIANRGGKWTVDRPDLPIAQAVSTSGNVIQPLPGGSVQTWNRNSVTYYDQTEKVAHFHDTTTGNIYDWAINGVAHGGDSLGKVTFIGGHAYDTKLPYSSNPEGPYLRFFYNSLFFNGSAVAKLDLKLSTTDVPNNSTSIVTLELSNTGSSVATNSEDIVLKLAPNVEYISIETGPEPVISGTLATGLTLYWGNSLGDIVADFSVLKLKVRITPSTLGLYKIVEFSGRYGDVFGESFTADLCRSVTVYNGPNPTIIKSPDERTYYPGQIATWTLSYRNASGSNLFDTVIDDFLPAGFTFKSAQPAPLSVIPQLDGTTRVRWKIGTLLVDTKMKEIVLTAYVTREIRGFVNTATIYGNDSYNYNYQKTDTANVNVIDPPIKLIKTVSPTGAIDVTTPGQILTYTLRPYYAGNNLLSDVLVSDAIPAYTTYVAQSSIPNGQYGYTPLPAKSGIEVGFGSSSLVLNSAAIKTDTTVSVVLTITNNSGSTMTNVVPLLQERLNGAVVSVPTPSSVASLPNGVSATFNYTAVLTDIGERLFEGSATAILNNGEEYTFPTAYSATVLVLNHLNSSPNNDVITWRIGSNLEGAVGETITSGYTPGVYAFRGGNTKEFSKLSISQNSSSWMAKSQPTNGIEKGGSLTSSGAGKLYGSEGNSKIFYEYNIVSNTWTRKADTSDNFNEGGSIQYLTVNGVEYVYALLGNSTRFRRFNVISNTWTTLANTPVTIKKGGALTTDGTYLYALQGDTKTGFYRYDIGLNTWSALASTPLGIGWGGSLTRIGNFIYAMRGDGKNNFYRYEIQNNVWTSVANTPLNVSDGGSLTNDGTYIYALQGRTKAFWRYTIATNTWNVATPTNFTGNVSQGGALIYDAGVNPQGRFTDLSTDAGLITSNDDIKITYNIASSTPVSNVIIPSNGFSIISANGATYNLLSGPTLVSNDNNITSSSDIVTYQWTIKGVAGALFESSLRFAATAIGDGGISFPTATSRSVLISPPLSFQVRVFDAVNVPSEVNHILNVGMISDDSALSFGVNSNGTSTPLLRPLLTLEKRQSVQGNVFPNEEITYTLVIKNEGLGSGDLIEIIDPIPEYSTYIFGSATISRSLGTSIIEPAQASESLKFKIDKLASDEMISISFRVKTAGNLPSGTYSITNQAKATAENVANTIYSNIVINHLEFTPALAVLKLAEQDAITDAGQIIDYTVYVSNNGNVPLTGIVVSDPLIPDLVYISGDNDSDGVLDLEELWLYKGIYIVTQSDIDNNLSGHFVNVATADSNETEPVSSEFEIEILLFPGLMLEKTADVESFKYVGDQIEYSFMIRNSGNVTLTNIKLTDELFSPADIFLPSDTLSPGEVIFTSMLYTVKAEDVIRGNILNTATATGLSPDGRTFNAVDNVDIISTEALAKFKVSKTVVNKPVGLDEEFIIRINGDIQTSVVLKHEETSLHVMVNADVIKGTKFTITEVMPMQFKLLSISIIETEHSEGPNRPVINGNEITIFPGNDITIIVENKYYKSGFFKAIDSIINFFKKSTP